MSLTSLKKTAQPKVPESNYFEWGWKRNNKLKVPESNCFERDWKKKSTPVLLESFGGGMKRIVWIALGLLMQAQASVYAASFDCSKATTQVERIICSSDELSKLDEELSSVYKSILRDTKYPDATKQAQRQSQLSWMRERDSCYGDSGCVRKSYVRRLSWLKLPIATTVLGKHNCEFRSGHTATMLQNGKVLIAGGDSGGIDFGAELRFSECAEIYDPATGKLNVTGVLNMDRSNHIATLLQNGKVLIVGGDRVAAGDSLVTPVNDAELYDPTTGTFSVTGSFGISRSHLPDRPDHTAILLPNGKVLAVTWQDGTHVSSTELYDSTTGKFIVTGRLNERHDHTVTLLPNGKVLLIGGYTGLGSSLASAELYDPARGKSSVVGGLNEGRWGHTATLLSNGKVLIVGGEGGRGRGALSSAELYDSTTGTSTATGSLSEGRVGHAATLLPNGRVLIVGGTENSSSIELYDPVKGVFSTPGRLIAARYRITATLLSNGKVLIVGGGNTAELYDPSGSNMQ